MLNFNQPSALEYFPRHSPFAIASGRYETDSIQLKLYLLFYEKAVIEWSIPESWGDCEFNVYKAEQLHGIYQKLNATVISSNTNHFVDTSITDVSKFRASSYVVEVKMPNGVYVKSAPITSENTRSTWVELRAKEILRRESLLLRKFVGVESYVFRKKTFGKRCPVCWDWTTEKVMRDNCETCFGTGFENGYFEGVKTLIQYDSTPNASDHGPQGLVEQSAISAWTINRPEIETFDLILRVPDFRIYRVSPVQTTELQTVRVRQILSLTELAKSNIEYKLIKNIIPQEYI